MSTDELYIMVGDTPEGPYSLDDLFAMWQAQSISFQTRYAEAGSSEWKTIKDFEAVFLQRVKGAFVPPSSQAKRPAPAVPSKVAAPKPVPTPASSGKPSENDSGGCGTAIVTTFLLLFGILITLTGLMSSNSPSGSEVVNLDLIAAHLGLVILGCTLMICGTIVFSSH